MEGERRRHTLAWAGVMAVLAALIWLLQGILLPFVAGLALAYLLDPVVDRLERLGLSRLLASILIIALAGLVVALAFVLLVPLLVTQLGGLIDTLARDQGGVAAFVATLESRLASTFGIALPQIQQGLEQLSAQARSWAGEAVLPLAKSMLTGGLALVNSVALVLVTPVVAYFLLCDWDKMITTLDSWLPRAHAATIRGLASEMNEVLAGFLRGQLTVCLILGVLYAIALSLIGMSYAILIGLGAGILGFVPFAGTWAGLLLSLAVAFSQFWPDDTFRIVLVAAVFAAGQALEGTLLSPNIVGKHVRLHPVWLIFALFAMGYLFGFLGVLVAVPFAAAAGVLGRFAVREYLASDLYQAPATAPAREADPLPAAGGDPP